MDAKYLVAALQMIILLWPIFCSISRITDHRHHYWDVAAGLVIGVVMAIFTVNIFP
jgi:phosphatidate phosphatase